MRSACRKFYEGIETDASKHVEASDCLDKESKESGSVEWMVTRDTLQDGTADYQVDAFNYEKNR